MILNNLALVAQLNHLCELDHKRSNSQHPFKGYAGVDDAGIVRYRNGNQLTQLKAWKLAYKDGRIAIVRRPH